MNKSRTTYTIYNFISGILGSVITILMQFIIRGVFIRTLGSEYLGINGLFSNILSMLSLAELGVGSAILYKLYAPISKKDNNRIAILIKFYKKIYIIIGVLIACIGLCLIPLLPLLINDYDNLALLGINATFIYLLYLLQTVSSYLFFAYKSAIIKANQKEYLINIINYTITILSGIIQIILLILFHNFVLYVIVLVLSVIAQNFAGALLADKLYPYINNKTKDKISKKEIIEIFKDCAAIFLYRINSVVLTATDNIIISAILGLTVVGMYSNYYIFYTAIGSLFGKVFDSVAHSLGNLHTTHNYSHEYKIFKTINLITTILGATAGIGIFCVSNEFIKVWLGEKWILAQPFSLLMGLQVYTLSSRAFLSKYRDSMGLFQQAKYRPLFGMVINLIVSIVLVKYYGICGVLIGTVVADCTTIMWYDPLIIHRYGFENKFPVNKYYKKNLLFIFATLFIGLIDYIICINFFNGFGWLSVIIHILICGISVPLIILGLFIKTEEAKHLIYLIKKELIKIKKIFFKRSNQLEMR